MPTATACASSSGRLSGLGGTSKACAPKLPPPRTGTGTGNVPPSSPPSPTNRHKPRSQGTNASQGLLHHGYSWVPRSGSQSSMSNPVSDLLHAQYRLSLLQWNAGRTRRRLTRPRPSLPSSTRTRTAKVWPSPTPSRSCQTLSSTRSWRSPRAGPRGASQLWLSAVSCADRRLAHRSSHVLLGSLAQRGRQETRRCHVAPPSGCTRTWCGPTSTSWASTWLWKALWLSAFNDPEFTAPGSPLWGAGGLLGANADLTWFVCMPRPFQSINTWSTLSPRTNWFSPRERETGTHHPVFTHFWRATKNDRKRF